MTLFFNGFFSTGAIFLDLDFDLDLDLELILTSTVVFDYLRDLAGASVFLATTGALSREVLLRLVRIVTLAFTGDLDLDFLVFCFALGLTVTDFLGETGFTTVLAADGFKIFLGLDYFSTVLDREILIVLTGEADFLVGDFFAGETLFIGELLLLLVGERDAKVFALLTDLGLLATGSAMTGAVGNPKPKLTLIGDFCFGSGFGTKAENIGRAPLILSGETLASAAAAVLPLRLLRSRPRRDSTALTATLGTGADFSFLTVDFDLEALLTGEGFGAAFFGEVAFLTLFERDFLSIFFVSFFDLTGDLEAVTLGVAGLAIDFATDALASDALTTDTLAIDALATDALAREALATETLATEALVTEGLASRALPTEAFLDGLTDLTGDLDFATDLTTEALTDCFITEALRVVLTFLGLGDFAGLGLTTLFLGEDF